MQAVRRALFIDGSNLYAAAKNLGFDIDYGKLRFFFESGSWLVRAYYYTAIAEDQDYSPVRPLADWLDYNGFTLVSKPAKEFVDHAGRRRIRGNMDVEIAVDALELAPHIDHMILMSGDGDFRRLIEAMQAKGVRVTVVSTIRTSPPMASDEVRRQADEFLDLLDIAPEIERRMPERGDAPHGGRQDFRRAGYGDDEAGPADRSGDDEAEDDEPPNRRDTQVRGPGDFREPAYMDDDEID